MSIILSVLQNSYAHPTEKERLANVPSLPGNRRMFHAPRHRKLRPGPSQSASHC
jgi:hypothetical protein